MYQQYQLLIKKSVWTVLTKNYLRLFLLSMIILTSSRYSISISFNPMSKRSGKKKYNERNTKPQNNCFKDLSVANLEKRVIFLSQPFMKVRFKALTKGPNIIGETSEICLSNKVFDSLVTSKTLLVQYFLFAWSKNTLGTRHSISREMKLYFSTKTFFSKNCFWTFSKTSRYKFCLLLLVK